MGCNQSKADDDNYPPGNPPIANSDRKSKALDVEDEKASVGCDENFPYIDEKDEKDKKEKEDVGNGNADDFKPLPPLVLKEEKTESETMQVTKEREDNIEHERVVIQKQVKTVREEVHMVKIVDGEEVCDTINEGTEEYRESGKEVLVIQEKMTKEELEEELRKMGQDVNLDEEEAKAEKKEEEHSEPPKENVVSQVTTTVVESEPVVTHSEEKTEVSEDGDRTVVTKTTTSTVEVVNGVQQEEVTQVESTTVVESSPPVAEDQVKVEVNDDAVKVEETANDISNEVEVEVQGLPDPEPLDEDLVEQEESIKGSADDGFLRWDAKPSEPEINYRLPGGSGEVIVIGSEQVPNIESTVTVSEEVEVEAAPAVVESVPEPEEEAKEEPEPVVEQEPEPVKEEEEEPVEPEPVVEEEQQPEPEETVTVVETESEQVIEQETVIEEEPKEEVVEEEPLQSDHEPSDHSDHEDKVVVEESLTVEASNSIEEPSDKHPTSGDGFLNWNPTPSEPEIVYRVPGGEGEVVEIGKDENIVESNGVDNEELQVKTVDDVLKSAEDQEQEVSD